MYLKNNDADKYQVNMYSICQEIVRQENKTEIAVTNDSQSSNG
jgi:hypothetical protein